MKKVRLIRPYLDMEIGRVFKTDGQTAMSLIERGIAEDPEALPMPDMETEAAMMEPQEEAILPKPKLKKGYAKRGRK